MFIRHNFRIFTIKPSIKPELKYLKLKTENTMLKKQVDILVKTNLDLSKELYTYHKDVTPSDGDTPKRL